MPPVANLISSYAAPGGGKNTKTDPFINYVPYMYINEVTQSVADPYKYYILGEHPDGGSKNPAVVNFTSPFTGYFFATGSTSCEYKLDGGDWVRLGTQNYYWIKVPLNGVSRIEVVSGDSDQFAALGPIYTNDNEQVMFLLRLTST